MKYMLGLIAFMFGTMAHGQVAASRYLFGDHLPGIDYRTNYLKDGNFQKNNRIGIVDSGFLSSVTTGLDGNGLVIGTGGSVGSLIRIQSNTFKNLLGGLNCEADFFWRGNASGQWKSYVTLTGTSTKVTPDYAMNASLTTQKQRMFFPCGTAAQAYDIVFEQIAATTLNVTVNQAFMGEALLGISSPDTSWTDGGPTIITATTTAPTKPSTITTDHSWWRRNGSDLEVDMQFVTSAGTGGTSGTGQYLFTIPANSGCVVNTGVTGVETSTTATPQAASTRGAAQAGVPTTSWGTGAVAMYSATQYRINLWNSGGLYISDTSFAMNQAVKYSARFSVPCNGWVPQTAVSVQNSDYPPTAWTPTFANGGSVTAINCTHQRKGRELIGDCTFTVGTVGSGTFSMTLPNGLVTDSGIPTFSLRGEATTSGYGVSIHHVLFSPGSNFIFMGFKDSSNSQGLNADTGTQLFANNVTVSMHFRVPIQGWTESMAAPQLVGSVVNGGTGVAKSFGVIAAGATLSTTCGTAGPCTLYGNTGSPAMTVSVASSGTYTITVPAGYCSTPLICIEGSQGGSGGAGMCDANSNGSSGAVYVAPTNTTAVFTCLNSAFNPAFAVANIHCDCLQ